MVVIKKNASNKTTGHIVIKYECPNRILYTKVVLSSIRIFIVSSTVTLGIFRKFYIFLVKFLFISKKRLFLHVYLHKCWNR